MPVRLQLFGSPKVESHGESHALPFERRNQVLVLAALRRTWVGRAELAAMLWPDQASKLAYTNVRKTLFRLKSLPWAEHIELQASAVRFEARTDVFEFDRALREERIADALPLYTGELLRGFDDGGSEAWSSWLGFERERLRGAWRAAELRRLAENNDAAEAIELSARLLEADPLDEAAVRAHMTWLAKAGQGMRSRQAYRAFADRIAAELGLAPAADLVALHETLGATPLQAPVLPAARDDFVGRAVELRKVAELLAQPQCRLLCVIGPGGIGKTRLARKAAETLGGEYRDGAAFVSIEGVTALDQFGGRVARELGLSLAGSAQPMDQVNAYLRDRHLLLVLDNVEDFGAHASLLGKILDACPRVKILATSRVRLGIAPEWSLPLEGLPCPEPEDRESAEAFDAVRLFIAAARRVAPALDPAAEMGAIMETCRLLEGVPLALELAAGWTRLLPCEEIVAELRGGTELLRAVDPGRSARHASLEEVFDQSWRRLSPAERDVLARLSAFRGGFTVEAARAVTGASLPVLGALMDKSLLRKEGARSNLHSLVHQLTSARLAGETRAATEAAHARYFHRFLLQTRRAVENGDRDAIHDLDTEFENCRAAWQWFVAQRDVESLARAVMPLLGFCDVRGRFEECLAMLNDAIAAAPEASDPRFEPLVMSAISHLEYRLDRYAEAEALALRALAATKATADHDTRLQCFKTLGATYLRMERYEDSRKYYKAALQQSPPRSDPHTAAAITDNIALVEKRLGRYDEARRMSAESLIQHRHLGDVAGEALVLNNLGDIQLLVGDLNAASARFADALALCDRHGLVNTRVLVLANLAEVAVRQKNTDLAEERARRALELAQQVQNRGVECAVVLYFARIALQRSDPAAARGEVQRALEIALAIHRVDLQRECLVAFAEIAESSGDARAASAAREVASKGDADAVADSTLRWIYNGTGRGTKQPP
jgi:predicted ATPase/DNA-binding SARP family transcriptional activator/Tfp pilus assembly protein PilF